MLPGYGAGNYQPVTQTKNKIIRRVTFTECELATGPREHTNKTLKIEVCSETSSFRDKKVEGNRFDDDNHADTCLLGRGLWVNNTHTYECNVIGL